MKLALIGKGISHSRSAEVYKRLLNKEIEYTLIDVSDERELPQLEELFHLYDGVSITAPYKASYFPYTVYPKELETLGIINTIKSTGTREYSAILTDLLAFKDIFRSINYEKMTIKIIGDGSMGKMVMQLLEQSSLNYFKYSRKLDNLDQISSEPAFFINTCSRDYVFDTTINPKSIFWDFNYDFSPHKKLANKCHYIDGYGLLEKQALHALNFWQSK